MSFAKRFGKVSFINIPEWFSEGASRYLAYGWGIEMDKIIFIPNMNPYYKESYITHFDIVESMINLSIPVTINYEISPLESQPGKDYSTYDTLKILLKSEASSDFSLILGSDQFIQFHKWKNFNKITNLVNIIVGLRNVIES